MSLTCGIDVGGTKIAGGVVDEDGNLLEERVVESPADDVAAMERSIIELVQSLSHGHALTAVGIGAAGYVSSDRATVLFAPNIAWRNVNLRGDVEAEIGLPVVVENDANAAAWGEFRFGAGADVDDLLLVTVGTGVGGGIVLNGELLRGGHGVAAEIGHLRLVPGGLRCGCGNLGCLEVYGSGSSLVRRARDAARKAKPAAAPLLARVGGQAEDLDGPTITAAAQEGDDFAIDLLAELGTALGEGLASLAAVLDPTRVVIGGGVSAAGELLLHPIRTAFVASLTGRGYRPSAEIVAAQLGNRAGLIGAADLARRR